MPELDPEILARALRWCAAAGSPPGPDAVRRALEPLTWDELLAVKATLAAPPPSAGLGLAELVALAREADLPAPHRGRGPVPAPPPPPRPRSRGTRARRPPPGPRIRRARDRQVPEAEAPAPRPLIDELYREEGRAVLERLVRRLGAVRPAVAAAVGESWRRPDGAPVGDGDLERLLLHHGLARAFGERERALLLHTLRKLGGVMPAAAREIGTSVPELGSAIDRVGIRADVDALRETRRREFRRRATLAQRARMFAADEEALADLGLLAEVEADLRRRLPEHVRALRASGQRPPLAAALGDSLSLTAAAVARLAERFALEVPPPRPATGGRPGSRPAQGFARRGPTDGGRGGRDPRGPRSAAGRGTSRSAGGRGRTAPSGPRSPGARTRRKGSRPL